MQFNNHYAKTYKLATYNHFSQQDKTFISPALNPLM